MRLRIEDIAAANDFAVRRAAHITACAPPFGSATLPTCVVAMLSPGYIKAEAAEVDVPVFIGLGDRDVTPEPRREPTAYEKATDITLFVCDRMGHMHNFASTREKLWDRIVEWCRLTNDPIRSKSRAHS